MREPVVRTIYDNYNLWNDSNVKEAKEVLLERDGNENPSDNDIWDELNDEDNINWKEEKYELLKFFDDGSTWILRGTNGRWDGSHEAGTIFTDFMEMFNKAMKDCDYVKLYDENGHFYFQCSHHDGTNCYEIKKLIENGIKYLENWEYDWNDKRSERYIHDQIMKRYSVLPHFAHKVYGCPKVQWESEVA